MIFSFRTLRVLVLGAAWALAGPVVAQSTDTLAFTLADAEHQFLTRNLALVAQQFQATAAILPMGANGQNAINVQQLLLLAGKRPAQVALATTNAEIARLSFADALRQLRFELHGAFTALAADQAALRVYATQIASFTNTISLYQQQLQKGNVAPKDVIRLRAFLLQLQNEQQAIRADAFDQEASLRALLAALAYLLPALPRPMTPSNQSPASRWRNS
jgi:outer membrane protein, heavy metal efflux system